jgi:hypothetical protein
LPTPTATERSGINPKTGRGAGLSKIVKMWPTPTTQEIEHPNMKLTKTGRRLTKDGKNSHSLNLADRVRMWPTPTTKGYGHASEGQTMIMRKKVEDGVLTEEEAMAMMNGVTLRPPRMKQWMWPTPTAVSRPNEGNIRMLRKKVMSGEISREEAEQMVGKDVFEQQGKVQKMMWPTPTSRDGKGGYIGGRVRNGKVSRDTLDVTVQHTDNKNKTGGTLNPTWVEWLMGYPKGWTDLNH